MPPRATRKDRPLAIGGDVPEEGASTPIRARERGRRVAGRPDVATLPHRNGTKAQPRTREDGEEIRATTVHLPSALLKRAARVGLERDRSFSQLVEEALGALVGVEEKRLKLTRRAG